MFHCTVPHIKRHVETPHSSMFKLYSCNNCCSNWLSYSLGCGQVSKWLFNLSPMLKVIKQPWLSRVAFLSLELAFLLAALSPVLLQRINRYTRQPKSLSKFESGESALFLLSFPFKIQHKPSPLVKRTQSWQNYSFNTDSCQVREEEVARCCLHLCTSPLSLISPSLPTLQQLSPVSTHLSHLVQIHFHPISPIGCFIFLIRGFSHDVRLF